MADTQYKILLGVQLDPAKLSNIQTQVNGIGKSLTPIKVYIDTDFTQKQVNTIKSQIQSLNNMRVNLGTGGNGINGFVNEFDTSANRIKAIASNTSTVIQSMRQKLASMNFDNNSIDTVTRDIERLGIAISNASVKMKGDKLNVTVKGIDELGRIVTVVRQLDSVSGQVSTVGQTISQTFNGGVQAIKSFRREAELIKNIKFRLDNGTFKNDISNMETRFNGLSKQSNDLRLKIELLKQSLISMNSASNFGDTKTLINEYERYEKVLKQVHNQLQINARAERESYNKTALNQSKSALSLEINNWLKKNSAAATEFGAKLKEIQLQISTCDKTSLARLRAEFNNVKREAALAGKTTQTFGDRLRTQLSRYSSYLSIASVFMYTTRAIRDMFQQVKAIDSAMTELKKVTDETAASYEKFLTDAASSAKEIGTTIDGLVVSTAGFARLGYGFGDSQELAKVANIYAVVGDEVEGVEGATQSLISTMAAFKNQADDISNGDFAMSIVDKMNEVGNNFAISSGGLGEALQRSASSMAAANNTLDETIALITAANTVAQNPEKVGRLLPTIKMAISVKLQRWTRPRKDFIGIFDVYQLGRVCVFYV